MGKPTANQTFLANPPQRNRPVGGEYFVYPGTHASDGMNLPSAGIQLFQRSAIFLRWRLDSGDIKILVRYQRDCCPHLRSPMGNRARTSTFHPPFRATLRRTRSEDRGTIVHERVVERGKQYVKRARESWTMNGIKYLYVL